MTVRIATLPIWIRICLLGVLAAMQSGCDTNAVHRPANRVKVESTAASDNTPDSSPDNAASNASDISSVAMAIPVAAARPVAAKRASLPKDAINITFDDIKFDMAKGAPFDRKLIDPKIERYQDQAIKIRGYILPGFQERGIREFVLVRDNMECCFGPGAALYDCILVTMSGDPINYAIRPITVEGKFSIEPFEGPDGYPLAIYRMEATRAD